MRDTSYRSKDDLSLYCKKSVFVLTYFSVFINKIHELFPYKSTESKLNLAIKSSRSIKGHNYNILEQKSSKLSMKSYILAFCQVLPCLKIGVNQRPLFDWLVGCFELNRHLRQYFSLYQVVSQREEKRKKK